MIILIGTGRCEQSNMSVYKVLYIRESGVLHQV